MSVETGYELLDALINNPMQAVLLFAGIYCIYQFLFQCRGMFADAGRHVKFELECQWRGIDRSLCRALDRFEEWDKNRKHLTMKQFITIEYCIYAGMVIYLTYQAITIDHEGMFYFNTVLIGIWSFLITLSGIHYYRKFKQEKLTLQKVEDVR